MTPVRGLPFVAAALLLPACAGEPAPSTWTETDSAGVRIVASTAPAEEWAVVAEPEIWIGADTQNGPTQFYQIQSLAFLPDDRFVVADGGTQEIRFFSTRGDFLTKVGRKGNGPEEFSLLEWLAVARDSLLVYDELNDRVSVWTTAGEFARTFRLEWFSGRLVPITSLDDQSVLAITVRQMTEMPHDGLVVDTALVSRYDASGAFVDSLLRVPHNQRVVHRTQTGQTVLAYPFSVFASLVPIPGGFCHAFGPESEIRCVNHQGVPHIAIRPPLPPRPVLPEHVRWFWDVAVDANPNSAPFFRRAGDWMVFPEHFPAYGDVLADDVGRIWAQVYPLPDETTLEWWVFVNGRWTGRLRVDAAFRLEAVSGDRLLGVWRDEMGVESVRLYRLDPASRAPAGNRPL